MQPKVVPWRDFSKEEHATWKLLFDKQEENRKTVAVPEFRAGLEILGITSNLIPNIDDINRKLAKLTGWRAVPVEGFEDPRSFYSMLARREFPIGCFIRDPKDLSYTPAPDVFHDLYGHIPFYVDSAYAEFCFEFGKRSSQNLNHPDRLRRWERLFWFTAEFALLETPQGLRIFGGGLLSSYAESLNSLSGKPTLLPFDLRRIQEQEFRIDVFQDPLFILPSRQALFQCLEPYSALMPP
jgi:phenylalanine-4-hydroxylase